MKKILLSIFLVFLVVMFSGCGEKKTKEMAVTELSQPGESKLIFDVTDTECRYRIGYWEDLRAAIKNGKIFNHKTLAVNQKCKIAINLGTSAILSTEQESLLYQLSEICPFTVPFYFKERTLEEIKKLREGFRIKILKPDSFMDEGKGFVVKGKKDEDYDGQYQHQVQRPDEFDVWNFAPELKNFGGILEKGDYRSIEWRTNVGPYPLKVISKIDYYDISDEEWQSIFAGLSVRFEGDVAAIVIGDKIFKTDFYYYGFNLLDTLAALAEEKTATVISRTKRLVPLDQNGEYQTDFWQSYSVRNEANNMLDFYIKNVVLNKGRH